MNTSEHAIRQDRNLAHVCIVPRLYSPSWWNTRLRIKAFKHKPRMVVIHEKNETPVEFIAFGGLNAIKSTLDKMFGGIFA